MKFPLYLTILTALVGTALADVARQQTVREYQRLLDNSPFTLPPVVDNSQALAVQVSPLDDWILSGILPMGDSFFVTLRHKSEPGRSEYMRGIGERSESGFELLDVMIDNDPTKSRVRIKAGGRVETKTFDLAALGVAAPQPVAQGTLAPPPAAANRPPGAGGRGGKKPVRQVRPRVNLPKKK